MDVYIVATVDQGDDIIKAVRCLLVPVLICTPHRLNSVLTWGLDVEKYRNPGLGDLFDRVSSLISKFSRSSVTSDTLKDVQPGMNTKVLQSSLRNDTRHAC